MSMPFDPLPLRALLDSHSPADADEARHMVRFRELARREVPPLPNSRQLLPPSGPGHLTASVFVLARGEPGHGLQRVLMLEHPKLQRLLQPGGHLEPDESDPRAAAARELLEETGYAFPLPDYRLLDFDIHRIPASPRRGEPEHEHFDVRYLVDVPAVPPPAPSRVESTPIHWLDAGSLARLPADEGLQRVFRKLGLI